MWLRDLKTNKIVAVIFGVLRNVFIDQNGEHKMARRIS